MLNIAVTKGRLEGPIINILEAAGYGPDELKDKQRKLIFQDTKAPVTYYLAKAWDTITYINHGAVDIAMVGSDVISEHKRTFYELLDLEIGKCQFVLAGKSREAIFKRDGQIRIGTKYPHTTKAYFQKIGWDVEIIKIEGSVELTPIVGMVDGIVDIMETGTTLKENGLIVIDTIDEVSTRLIVNQAAFRTKSDEVEEFYKRVKGVVDGKSNLS